MYNKVVILGLITITIVAILFIYKYNENMEDVNGETHVKSLNEKRKQNIIKSDDSNHMNKTYQDVAEGVVGYDENDSVFSELVEDPGQYLLSDGNNRKDTTLGNLCSLSCCSPGWDTEKIIDKTVDPTKYEKTNLYCRNSLQNSGCMCVTKSQKDHAATRGGNHETRKVSGN